MYERGHIDIYGSERANILANSASRLSFILSILIRLILIGKVFIPEISLRDGVLNI